MIKPRIVVTSKKDTIQLIFTLKIYLGERLQYHREADVSESKMKVELHH